MVMTEATVTYRRVLDLEPPRLRQLASVMASDGDEPRYQEFIGYLTKEFACLDHNRRMYILAERGQEVIGFLRLWHSPYIDEWVIDGLVVSPMHRRRSIGCHLLEHALQLASQSGATSVIAHICRDNVASLRLHEKLGFIPETQQYRNSYGQDRSGVGWQYRIRFPNRSAAG